uniref:Uncharacterized protein n=1 Tax=Arundo donax TaxID=35708 RepID=A0A0A8XNH3_ARUDO
MVSDNLQRWYLIERAGVLHHRLKLINPYHEVLPKSGYVTSGDLGKELHAMHNAALGVGATGDHRSQTSLGNHPLEAWGFDLYLRRSGDTAGEDQVDASGGY